MNLLRRLRAAPPQTEKFILYLDNAACFKKAVVTEWLKRHHEFRLVYLPASSPNLNLIERLWKLARKEALSCWHKTFEEMPAAVSGVLDHLDEYRKELDTLMRDEGGIPDPPRGGPPHSLGGRCLRRSSPLRSAIPWDLLSFGPVPLACISPRPSNDGRDEEHRPQGLRMLCVPLEEPLDRRCYTNPRA